MLARSHTALSSIERRNLSYIEPAEARARWWNQDCPTTLVRDANVVLPTRNNLLVDCFVFAVVYNARDIFRLSKPHSLSFMQ